MKRYLTCEELDGFGCDDPECTADHNTIFFYAACHPESATWTSFNKHTEITIECQQCRKPIVGILVASSPPIPN